MKRSAKTIGILGPLLLIMLLSTQPARLPTIALVLPFVAVFCILVTTILFVVSWRGRSITPKIVRVSFMAATLPVTLLLLQSLGQLTLRDASMLLLLFLIVYLYIAKSEAKATG